jgi:hypothetical protein
MIGQAVKNCDMAFGCLFFDGKALWPSFSLFRLASLAGRSVNTH